MHCSRALAFAMAPKKKQVANAKATAENCFGNDLLPSSIMHNNSELLLESKQKIDTIDGHPLMAGWRSDQPLSMEEGGCAAPISQQEFVRSMLLKDDAEITCGGSWCWQDVVGIPCAGVTLQKDVIKSNYARVFGGEVLQVTSLSDELVLGVPSHFSKEELAAAWEEKRFLRLSGDEKDFAKLQWLFQVVENGDRKEIAHARKLFRNIKVTFMKVPASEFDYTAVRLRERKADEADEEAWGFMQICEFIAREKHKITKINQKVVQSKMVAVLKKKAPRAKRNEPWSEYMIGVCLDMETLFLPSGIAKTAFFTLDEMYGARFNPLSTAEQMKLIMSHAKTTKNIAFFMRYVVDGLKMGHVSPGLLSCNKLKEEVPLALLKLDGQYHMIKWMFKNGWPANEIELIQEKLQSFESVRLNIRNYPDEQPCQLQWKRNISDSASAVLGFIERMTYGSVYDWPLRIGVKSKKGFDEVLEYQQVAEAVQCCIDALKEEQQEARNAKAPDLSLHGSEACEASAATESVNPVDVIDEVEKAKEDDLTGYQKSLGKLDEAASGFWKQDAEDSWRKYLHFIENFEDRAEFMRELKQCDIIAAKSTGNGIVLHVGDLALLGEATCAPHNRVAGFQDALWRKSVRAVMDTRGGAPDSPLGYGEIAAVLDSGRLNVASLALQPFKLGLKEDKDEESDDEDDDVTAVTTTKSNTCKVKRMVIVKSEDSLRQRKTQVRQALSLNQTEHLHAVTRGKLYLPERKGLHFGGTNRATALTEVSLPSFGDEAKCTIQEKKDIYTDRYRINTSGLRSGMARRLNNTVEPFTWWNKHLDFWCELLHRLWVTSVIDYTPGSGVLAEACLKMKVYYAGICMSKKHCMFLEQRMELTALKLKCDGTIKLWHNVKCAAALNMSVTSTPENNENTPKKATPKKKGSLPQTAESVAPKATSKSQNGKANAKKARTGPKIDDEGDGPEEIDDESTESEASGWEMDDIEEDVASRKRKKHGKKNQ